MKNLLIKTWGWIKPYLTPKMIPILLTLWLCTNGIWYFIALYDIGLPILQKFAIGYLAFLWTPFAPEKFLIIYVALKIYKILYKENFQK